MKKFFNSPARFLAVISALLLIIFWSVWFFAFRYYLIWLEGFSYFSTLPDFAAQYRLIPEGLPGYIGAFLHQFYSMPVLGAAIQAFFTIWPTVCIGIIRHRPDAQESTTRFPRRLCACRLVEAQSIYFFYAANE